MPDGPPLRIWPRKGRSSIASPPTTPCRYSDAAAICGVPMPSPIMMMTAGGGPGGAASMATTAASCTAGCGSPQAASSPSTSGVARIIGA